MKRYIQYEPFNIYIFEASAWEHPVHNHTYSEIIFIKKGKGKHCINGNSFSYQEGDIFLLGPEDYHYFEIEQPTLFCYIRFTENFINDTSQRPDGWQQKVKLLLNTRYQSAGSIVKPDSEKKLLNHLLEVLIDEYNNNRHASFQLITDSVLKAILGILARNITRDGSGYKNEEPEIKAIENLLAFIRQNLYQPELLKVEYMARRFNFSQKYLGIYFKQQTGEPLQQYILKYRLKLIENRLKFSTMSISEITFEFGFTDESHLYKIFRKYYGVSPKDFRNKHLSKGEQA
jgi:AraC family transcriptional regulator, L-rhamnose operon regulatory protein RhaS